MSSSDLTSISTMILTLKEEMNGLKEEVRKLKNPDQDDRLFSELSNISRNVAAVASSKTYAQVVTEDFETSSRLGRARSPGPVESVVKAKRRPNKQDSSNVKQVGEAAQADIAAFPEEVQRQSQEVQQLPQQLPQRQRDPDTWHTMQHRRLRNGRPPRHGMQRPNSATFERHASRMHRNPGILGTRRLENSKLLGVEKIMDLFVGGLAPNTSAEVLEEYCNSNGVLLKKVEALPSKSNWYSCFMISVNEGNRDKLLNAEFWPEDVKVRKFYRPRNPRNISDE